MVDIFENTGSVAPIQTVKSLVSVKSVYVRGGNSGISDMSITSDINNFFALAIEMSFAQMGAFDGSVLLSRDSFSSEPLRQVLIEPFMGSLLEALQSQNVLAYQSLADNSSYNSLQSQESTDAQQSWFDISINTANSGVFGIPGYQEYDYYFQGKNDGLEMNLRSLIQKVSSIGSGALNKESNNSALFSLLLSFQKLIGFSGRSGRNPVHIAALGFFLKTLSKNIQGIKSIGNFINIFY